jgi:cytochrome b6
VARTRLILAGAGALAFLALAVALSAPASAATYNVTITEYQFTPQNLTINALDTVNWTNAGTMGHDVTFQAGFGSGSVGGLAVGQSFEYTFTTPGVFKYHCEQHAPLGYDPPNLMIGQVTVLAPSTGPLSPPVNWSINLGTNPPAFLPNSLEIATGDTVTFLNNASIAHDVLFEAGFGTGAPGSLAAGQSWSFTFNSTGAFRFRCQLHSGNFGAGMVGEITVYNATLRPAVAIAVPPPPRISLGASFPLSGTASDNTAVTGVFLVLDGGPPQPIPFANSTSGDPRLVNWSANVSSLLAGTHTLSVFASNGAHNSTLYSETITVAPASGPSGPPSGNPFGGTFVFEDILANYFWLIVGVSVILIAVLMMFLSYSGKLQNYYIFLLTALDERHRFFAYARPTREFLYTIQRQMPRTHTERYNLKVIWYWYPLYCLGGLSFAAFIIETITGIILGFYYIPEGTGPNTGVASPAYVSMQTIMTKVTFGYIFRALHHWGAHMMVAAVFLHMMRVYFVGAYKNPRELNWLLGVILLNVTLLFGYTGYLLPWDQLSFWAGQIGLEMANTIPVIGEILGNMVFGGPELSPATVIRMYYLHVFVLPLIGGALMVLHMGIVWMQGVAEPH